MNNTVLPQRALRTQAQVQRGDMPRRRVRAGTPPTQTFASPPAPATVAQAPEAAKRCDWSAHSPTVGRLQMKPRFKVRGALVAQGDIVGAVIALGMPFSLRAPRTGFIAQLHVTCGSSVEYGQKVLTISQTSP